MKASSIWGGSWYRLLVQLGLVDGAREAVDEEPRGGLLALLHGFLDELESDRNGDELPVLHQLLTLAPHRCPVLHLVAQQVAGG